MGFRRRQVVAMTLMAGAVALTTSLINAALLARVEIRAAREDADQLARTLYHQASRVIEAHASNDVRSALGSDPGLRAYAEAVIGYSPLTLYAAILDREGGVLFHSDPRQRGRRLAPTRSLRRFSERDVLHQLWVLTFEHETLAVDLPFSVDGKEPFGTVRVAISTLLLRKELAPVVGTNAALAAAIVVLAFLASFYLAHRLLAPLEVLRQALKRIDTGQGGAPLDLRDDADVSRVAEFFDAVSRRLTRAGPSMGRAWLEATLAGSQDAVMILDRQGRIRFINEPGRKLLGETDRDRLHGRTLDSILDPAHPLPTLVRRAMQDGMGVEPTTESIEGGDGTSAEHLLSVQALRDHDQLSGFMLTARDMRQLSRLVSSLSYSQKLAALGRLTSGVAHEIRKPLQAMVMNVELLQAKVSDGHPDARRHLDVLTREIRQLDRVIGGFLQFTRPEELRPVPVDLEELLAGVTDTIASVAERNDVRLDSQSEPDLPRVHGSEDLLRQAFLNILTNACDAMPDGGKLRLSASHSGDGHVIVTVRDTGIGVPPENIPKVFDLYHTTKEGGSGIGLSLVYRIIQLHGGEVRLESEVGVGTVVTVSLPVAAR